MRTALIASALLSILATGALAKELSQSSDLTPQAFMRIAEREMPLRVKRVFLWKAGSTTYYVIEMFADGIPNAPRPVLTVNFQTGNEDEFAEAIRLAKEEAAKKVKSAGQSR